MSYYPRIEWEYYASSDYKLEDKEFRAEALNVAREIFKPARIQLEKIVECLRNRGYQFEFPDRALTAPLSDASSWVTEFRQNGLYLPVTFQAWIEIVGTVDLNGQDPSWPSLSTAKTSASQELLADPLQVDYDLAFFANEIEQWKLDLTEQHVDSSAPFTIDFSADRLHKADISGGPPYALQASQPAVDPVVLYESRGMRFLTYTLRALEFGGFIGFDTISTKKPTFIEDLVLEVKKL